MLNSANRFLIDEFESLLINLQDAPIIDTGSLSRCGHEHLMSLCSEAIRNAERYPEDKLCRWYGFIIGVMSNSEGWSYTSTLARLYTGEPSSRQADVMRKLLNRYLGFVLRTPVTCRLESVERDMNDVIREALASAGKSTFESISIRLGHIQGVLAVKGLIDVDEEREFTRPLLHSLHDQPIPTFAPEK